MQTVVKTNANMIGSDYSVRHADETDDDLLCKRLLDNYLADTNENKHDTITLEEFARQEGVTL